MGKIKRFEDFVSEMDRSDEIEAEVKAKSTPDVKSEEEDEEEAEKVQGVDEAGEANLGTGDGAKEIVKPVSEMLKEAYESLKSEAKVWEEDAHDEHTVENYMEDNAKLVATLAANSLKEMKEDMETEAYEACLNKMSEAFSKKLNEVKEMKDAVDAEDVE